MGFTFMSKALATPRADGSHPQPPEVQGSRSTTKPSSSTHPRRPNKLFTTLRLGHKDKKGLATPSNGVPTVRTPDTEPVQYGVETVLKEPKPQPQARPIQLEYHDSVTHSLLEEQEWIRQQLFYAEEGVEVTAQFQHQQFMGNNHIEEKKEEESPNTNVPTPAMISVTEQVTPTKSDLGIDDDDDDEEIPPTPMLDKSERDPTARFPAVAAAVARANEQRKLVTVQTPTIHTERSAVAAMVSPSPEKPFDEEDTGPEDPTIMEIENTQSKEEQEYSSREDDVVERNTGTASPVPPASCASQENSVARQLLDVFHCGDDFTEFSGSAQQPTQRSCRLVDAFYDNSCWTYRDAIQNKRPFYDEAFSQRFLKDIMNEGINLLWHLPPDKEEDAVDDENWSGRSVLMKIQPGSCYSTNGYEPKLVWTTLGGVNRQEKKVARCLVPLLSIQSVSTFRESICEQPYNEIKENENTNSSCGVNLRRPEDDDEDVCLFSITTEEGDVQVFEAATPRERDLFVTGLKNVIARLSFHVIVGDAGASSELYCERDQDAPLGELPSFASPVKNMNRIAHGLMD